MFFDPLYLLIIGPGMLLALWASHRVKSTFERFSTFTIAGGASGAEVAAALLSRAGLRDVAIELHQGWLSDHYDPTQRRVRLSPAVYHGRSAASVAVAAHEVGHAIQHAERYAPMRVRQVLVGPASLGSTLSYLVIIAGALVQVSGLIWLGIILFSVVVLFQLVTLPVEFDASARAKHALVHTGIVSPSEAPAVAKVLNAAALTYVASLVTSVLTLLYFVLRFAGNSRH